MPFSAYHYLWTYRMRKDMNYPLKLCVNINGERKYYKTDYFFTKSEWEKINGKKLRDQNLKEVKRKLQNKVDEVLSIIGDLEFPTHQSFEQKYNRLRLKVNLSVRFWFEQYISKLERLNKPYNSIRLLKTAINSFEAFKPNLKFQDVDKNFLNDYETWMLKENPESQTTIGIYITRLRTIFNYAIDEERVIPRELYPFGKQHGGYVIKTTKGRKPALTRSQVIELLSYECDTNEMEFARDIWVILYLLNGMNIIDLCRLRYKNIDFDNNYFYYQRTKTRGTKIVQSQIEGGLHPIAKKIIEKYGNSDQKPENYVFPFLNELRGKEMNHLKEEFNIKIALLKKVNNPLKPFREKLNLPFDLTVATARHSFASISHYELGYPQGAVGEGMGHSSIEVTDHYFSGMDIGRKKQMNLNLLPLKIRKRKKK